MLQESTTVSSAGEEKAVAVVEESTTAQTVEGVIVADSATTTGVVVGSEVATTTGVVVDAGVKMVAADTSGHGGKTSIHRAGKEVAAVDPRSSQGQATSAATSEGEEEFELFDRTFGFFAPATVVGSRAFRSRDRVPHPKDIPNRGDVFDDERLERVWCVGSRGRLR